MKPLKILIVEDELVTAADIQETLEKAGHRVVGTARNFREAIGVVKRDAPDLALIDIVLKGSEADGIATAKALLERQAMPIIFLTANSETSTVQRAAETHPAAYLLKPFRQTELAIQVELAYYNYRANQGRSVSPQASESLFLPVEQGKGHLKISKNDVMYLSAAGSYVEVYLHRESKPLVFSMNLGYLSQFFMTHHFYRLSRSLVVNLMYLERIEKNQLFLTGRETPLPFPESQHRELLHKLAVIKTP